MNKKYIFWILVAFSCTILIKLIEFLIQKHIPFEDVYLVLIVLCIVCILFGRESVKIENKKVKKTKNLDFF